MSRLVTFGCSHVYGHGLPDCHIPPDLPGLLPSNMAWPSILAEKLGRECVNLSSPGIGNLAILMKVLKYDFKQDDLVIIAFTYFGRYDCHRFLDRDGNSEMIRKNTEDHRKLILADMGLKYPEFREYWSNWLAIHHAVTYLKSIKTRYFFHLAPMYGSKDHRKPDIFEFENYWEDVQLIFKDYAPDKKHQGLESHRLQSELIYSKIKEYELR